jgi:hypothetical protein
MDNYTSQKKLEAQENPLAAARGDIQNFFGDIGKS